MSCTDEGPAFDGQHALIVGLTSEEGDFVELPDGASLAIDVGSQGLQHVFYSARVHTGDQELTLIAKFTRDDGVVVGRGTEIIEACSQRWLELSDARLVLDQNAEMKGTIEVKVGSCPAEGCAFDDAGNYVLSEVLGEVSRQVTLNVYI